VVLDSIVTVVDCRNIRQQLRARAPDGAAAAVNEAQQQVAYADTLLLNKTDLVSAAELSEIEASLRAHNATVHIVHCAHCRVDLGLLLDRGGYRGCEALGFVDAGAAEGHAHGDGDCHDDHCHDAACSTHGCAVILTCAHRIQCSTLLRCCPALQVSYTVHISCVLLSMCVMLLPQIDVATDVPAAVCTGPRQLREGAAWTRACMTRPSQRAPCE
jgi:hypothetical protein